MTRQEAITKIENYKNKMRVIGAECKFEFDVRKDGAGDAMIVITNLYAEPGDEILIPPFVAYIDADAYESAHSGRGCCRDYTIIYPNGCDVFRGDRDNKRFILRFSAGIAVNETHPYVSSEGGVLLSKEKNVCTCIRCTKEMIYTRYRNVYVALKKERLIIPTI